MRSKLSTAFLVFAIALSAACNIVRTVYSGPRLPADKIAVIRCLVYPAIVDGKKISKGAFAESWTLKVLPGTHAIVFEQGYQETTATHTFTRTWNFSKTVEVKAGHFYRMRYDDDKKEYIFEDVTDKK
ncbi:MAG: hypothetical protein OEW18_02025 [Candidatus Aminicenantes bacterium]|nr:hypothetical protein [Candidatus Aminicenantes bacterium]